MIKAIIFDFGNVVFKTDWHRVDHGFIKKYRKSILAKGNKELEEVYIKTNAECKSVKPYLQHIFPNENINEIVDFYKARYIKNKVLNKELLKLIRSLKQKYELYGFTDTNEEHFDANLKSGTFKDFKKVFTSFDFCGKKSEGDIFYKLVREIKIKPEELLFIDDYLPNIENARKAGLNAIQYTGFPKMGKFKKELKKILNEK
jgi:HAD superfamily hydrolase (TIGR01509 family)